jgi:hypothetical protein
MSRLYVLEVQKYISDEEVDHMNGKFTHVGYMDKIFHSKRKACEYYDMHNNHMRSLNAHGTWRSDWDPHTRFRYVVREYGGECRNFSPFSA